MYSHSLYCILSSTNWFLGEVSRSFRLCPHRWDKFISIVEQLMLRPTFDQRTSRYQTEDGFTRISVADQSREFDISYIFAVALVYQHSSHIDKAETATTTTSQSTKHSQVHSNFDRSQFTRGQSHLDNRPGWRTHIHEYQALVKAIP